MINTRPACLAPWRALSIKANGDVGPDAQYGSRYGNLFQNDLDEILKSKDAVDLKRDFVEGRFGQYCGSCEKKEKTVGHSRRLFFEHTIKPLMTSQDLDTLDEPDIYYLDLNLSNTCNLKCRMCNSVSSTSWISDEKVLLSKGVRTYHRPKDNRPVKIELNKVLEIFKNPKPFRNLKYLALRGGEPLLEIENIKVLEKFIEWDLAKNITLDISTNGSVISDDIKSLMEEFRETHLYLSIEGAGPLYNYIRGGDKFSIADLENKIKIFRSISNVTIIFAVTVSIYNIFSLDLLWNWLDGVYQSGDEIIMTNAVVRPEYLNFQILPRSMKMDALGRLEASGIREGPHHTGKRLVGDIGKTLIRQSLLNEVFTPQQKRHLIKQFTEFNQDVDELRKTRLGDVAQELLPLFSVQHVEKMLLDEHAMDLSYGKK